MSELNEKREVLQTRNFEERKKGCFLSHLPDSWHYSILQQISLFHSMIYKYNRVTEFVNFNHTKEPPIKKDNTFLGIWVALITKVRRSVKQALYKWMAMNIQVTSSATYSRPEHYMVVSQQEVRSLLYFFMQVKEILALITLKAQETWQMLHGGKHRNLE